MCFVLRLTLNAVIVVMRNDGSHHVCHSDILGVYHLETGFLVLHYGGCQVRVPQSMV